MTKAEGLLSFAKQFELIAGKDAKSLSLVELDTSDEAALAAALPGCGLQALCSRTYSVYRG